MSTVDAVIDKVVLRGVRPALYLTVAVGGSLAGVLVYDVLSGWRSAVRASALSLVAAVWIGALVRLGRQVSDELTENEYVGDFVVLGTGERGRVEDVPTDVAGVEGGVLDRPSPRGRFQEFGGSALQFELPCWIPNPATGTRVVHRPNRNIYERFREAGIGIPFPQREIEVPVDDPSTPAE